MSDRDKIISSTDMPAWVPKPSTKFSLEFRKRWSRLRRGTPGFLKRALDVMAAGTVMLAGLPAFLLIAALIKIEDRGPIFYWQWRVGRHGKLFRFPKFRSMVTDAEARLKALQAENQHGGEGVTFKMKRDPRITRVGRILRRYSIDELPQLLCVLRGDMTLVGPRPALPREVERYSIEDRRRLDAVPGITCIWQVSGRSELPFPVQARLDAEYIENQSLSTDIKILAATVPAVITGKGAY